MQIAVTCITNELLRSVASLALRHAGFRVLDTETVEGAIAAAERTHPDLVFAGVLADPAGDLARWCTERQIQVHVISPQMSIAELGRILQTVAPLQERLSGGSGHA